MKPRKNYGVSRGEALSCEKSIELHEIPTPFAIPLLSGFGLYVGMSGLWGVFLSLVSAPLYLLDLLIWVTVLPSLAVLWTWEYSKLYGTYASLSDKTPLIVVLSLSGFLLRLLLIPSYNQLSSGLFWLTHLGLTLVSTAILIACCYWVDLFVYKDLPDADQYDL